MSACRTEDEPPSPVLRCELSANAEATADGEIHLENACGAIHLIKTGLEGEGAFRVDLYTDGESILPVIVAESEGAVFRGLRLSGTWDVAGTAAPVVWRQGYQSWSSSGVFALGPADLDENGFPLVGGDALDTLGETPWSSWWGGLVGRQDGGSLHVGVASAAQTRFHVAFEPDTVHLVWGGRGESVAVADGDELYLDRVRLQLGPDANGLYDAWASAVATLGSLPADPLGTPPVGWSSWTAYYDNLVEDDVLAELEAASALPEGSVFQIDDGWQRAWGDWTAGEDFPSGTDGLADSIAAHGFQPGLWIAPFYVDHAAPIYAEHPDWWVRDSSGTEFSVTDRAILDISAPGAADWIAGVVSDRVDDGFTYLKLDFLFAGAVEGIRSQPMTGMEAYAQGMDVLRAAAGEAWVLGCGAPLLPSVGWVDSFRTGADIAFVFDPDPRQAYVRTQARQTAARAFSRRWWWVDPDSVSVRAPLTDDEVYGTLAAALVAGGPWLLGDSFVGVDVDRANLALSDLLLDRRLGAAVPLNPLASVSGFDVGPPIEFLQQDDQVPTEWDLPGGERILLNLGNSEIVVWGPGGVELWSGDRAEPGPRSLLPGTGELWLP